MALHTLCFLSLLLVFSTSAESITNHDRFIQLEVLVKDLLKMVEEEREINVLQNIKMATLENILVEHEEKYKKELFENAELKKRVFDLEIKISSMDTKDTEIQKGYTQSKELLNYPIKSPDNFKNNALNVTRGISASSVQSQSSLVFRGILKKIAVSNEPRLDHVRSSGKRLLTGTPSTPPPVGVAFSAYVKKHETHLTQDHTILYDGIVTNIGGHYNPHTGAFTVPSHGVYVFTWNLYCDRNGFIFSEIAVNSRQIGSMYTSCEGSANIRTTTGIVVAEVNKDDVVLVRTHPTHGYSGNLYSDIDWRSTFNGWLLF
ncbi:uncharacterized protein LOC134275032 [Saccostrea cucullata]|uniref:uncharacterized protein LOC134275032 n=1 Tax=Saccostrea cuccullata TaxID=36930 RepID=UPI002ED62AA2